MVIKVPGMKQQVGVRPLRMALVLLVLVPLVWGAYVLFSFFQAQAKMHEGLSAQANAVLTEEPQGTLPPIIFPTTPPQPTGVATAQPTAGTVPDSTAEPVPTTGSQAPTEYNPLQGAPTPPLPAGPTPTQTPPQSTLKDWNGEKRINVLLMGIDQRTTEITRPDTIIIASLDFEQNRAYVLSVPRDLYVWVPGGFGWEKLNTAYAIGENPKYKSPTMDGPTLLIRTLRYNFGIEKVHGYARVNFDAFRQGVNVLGGINVYVHEHIVDKRYPDGARYTTVTFKPGWQLMGGERALRYARTRRTTNGDLDRIRRQQQVLLAIQQKAKNPQALLRAPALLQAMGENVRTTFTLQDQLRLAQWGIALPKENIKFYAVAGRIATIDGASVVYGDKKQADQTLLEVFGPGASLRTYPVPR